MKRGAKVIDLKAKRPSETHFEWRSRITRMNQDERDRSEPIVPSEAEQHGTYRNEFVTHLETNTKAQTRVNAHDPVKRWEESGRLSTNQAVVIAMCRRLWELAGLRQKITATYGERMPHGIQHELRALTEIEAREDLHRIQDYVPRAYWNVFEQCCRWGEPAGVAGSTLGYGDRNAETRAHQIVVFVADVIAMRERV